MPRVSLKRIPIRPPNPLEGWEVKAHWGLLTLYLGLVSLALARPWLDGVWSTGRDWPDVALLLVTAASTLVSLSRQLPAQNVILAATLMGLFGGTAYAINAFAGVPFGPIVYSSENIGRPIMHSLPWVIPVAWPVVLLNARGVAKLMLKAHRANPYYGFYVIGLTVMLMLVFELVFQPYATAFKHYWVWRETKLSSTYYGTPWTNFLGCSVVSLLVLLFVTPALINKSPVRKPPNFHPLVIWETLGLLFLVGEASCHLWWVFALTALQLTAIPAICFAAVHFKRRPG